MALFVSVCAERPTDSGGSCEFPDGAMQGCEIGECNHESERARRICPRVRLQVACR